MFAELRSSGHHLFFGTVNKPILLTTLARQLSFENHEHTEEEGSDRH
jgi:hypothetical protein